MDQTQNITSEEASQVVEDGSVLAILNDSLDQAMEEVETEEVTTGAESVKKTEANEEEDANLPESEEEESTEEEEPEEDSEEEEEEESKTYQVAGKKYDNFDDAVSAVNKISGDNTRLAGEINLLNQKLSTVSTEITQRDELVKTLQSKVKEWEDYFDDEEHKEKPKAENISETVKKVLEEERKRETETALKQRYAQELTDLSKEEDYETVLPEMQRLANQLGDSVKNISPKDLYKMARGFINSDKNTNVLETAKQIANDKTKKQLAKKQASRVIGGNSSISSTKYSELESNDDEILAIL